MKTVRIRLDRIDTTKMSPPHKFKYMKYYSYYHSINHNNNKLNEANPIVVDNNNAIVDGYCSYLIISKSKQKTIKCIKVEPKEKLQKVLTAHYLRKNHSLSSKAYSWRIKKFPVVPNEVVINKKATGNAPILIKKITMIPKEQAIIYSYLKPKSCS